MPAAPYPLRFEPILKAKVWGGRRLAAYGKHLPDDRSYGESWEVADLDETEPGGGGGGAAHSIIANGPLEGHTLHHAIAEWGAELLGERTAGAGAFPLLLKLLDAREHLSIQVHPTDAYVRNHPGTYVKSESWYVIDAAPDAELFIGLQPDVGPDQVDEALAGGHLPDVLRRVPAVRGDCHHLPSGTVHALGAGILVAEIQSASDTTFRLYDWTREYARAPRELHIEAALANLTYEPPPPITRIDVDGAPIRLASTEHYELLGVRAAAGVRLSPLTCSLLMGVQGETVLTHAGVDYPLPPGSAALVPAGAADAASLDASASTALIAGLS